MCSLQSDPAFESWTSYVQQYIYILPLSLKGIYSKISVATLDDIDLRADEARPAQANYVTSVTQAPPVQEPGGRAIKPT